MAAGTARFYRVSYNLSCAADSGQSDDSEHALVRELAVNRQWDAPGLLRFWHLASVDAPTVAVVWSLGFAWAARVRLPSWAPLLLALGTWVVYIGDRLLDARAALRTGATQNLRERHHFHWRHRRIFIPLAVSAACVAALIAIFLMPTVAREGNSVLAAVALAYFTRVHSGRMHFEDADPVRAPFLSALLPPFLSKELLVGVLFAAACALPALSRCLTPWPLLIPVGFFALLAWLNCHAIECWESGRCERGRFGSAFGQSRRSRVFLPAGLLGLLGLLLTAVLFQIQPRSAGLVATGAVSALLLALLDRFRHHFTSLALRAAADLVLLCPAVLLLRG